MTHQRRVTIKDIATRAGVSTTTVHLSLMGKPGPRDETRQRIMEIAEELRYECNSVASSLKRGVTRIAAVLPALTADNRFYYTPIWEGVRAYCDEVKDFNIELVEVPYVNELAKVPMEAVLRVKAEEKIAGLIILGDIEPEAKAALRMLSGQGMPIVLVHNDAPEVGRICCVQAGNYAVGCAMGEILLRQTPQGSSVLICAGDPNAPANAESTRGAEDYLRKGDPACVVHKLNYSNDMEALYHMIVAFLKEHREVAACCSVTARGSVQLARALEDTGNAGSLPAIGSDVFEENLDYLARGVFINLLHKNPYGQGWSGAEKLFNHVIRNQHPSKDVFHLKGEVIFRSLAFMQESSQTPEK